MNERTKNFLLFAGGLAVGSVIPVLAPTLAESARPLAKALIKQGAKNYQRLQVSAARAAESLEDFVAEVRSEMNEAPMARSTSAAASAVPDKSSLS